TDDALAHRPCPPASDCQPSWHVFRSLSWQHLGPGGLTRGPVAVRPGDRDHAVESLSGSTQPPLDGGDARAHVSGDLDDGHALDTPEQQGHALLCWEPLESRVDAAQVQKRLS